MVLRKFLAPLALVSAACGGASVPAPVPAPTPAPRPEVAAPASATPSTLAFAYQPGRYAARLVAEATSTVSGSATPDSQRVRSEALIVLDARAADGGLQIGGTLDSLMVSPTRIPEAGTGYTRLPLPLAFTASLGPAGHALLRVGRDSAGGCWSEARAVLDPLHSLFPWIPSPLREGARWRDSVEIRTCRMGIPVVVREVRELALDRVSGEGGALIGHISYVAATTASGARVDRGARAVYAGRGDARGNIEVDAIAGVVRRDESEGRYQLSVSVDGVERTLMQRGRRLIQVAPRD